MATCKDCFHDYICFNSNGETKYYGKDIAANNVEQLCPKYKQKPALPLTCKDCIHNDACTDMLEALGFKVDGDGHFAAKRCRTFKYKNNYYEVVRCKDCEFRIFDDVCKEYYCNSAYGMCGAIEDNSFCSYGERKDNERKAD